MRQFVLVETFREVCIRLDIGFLLQKQLDAYIRINEALALYLTQICNLSLFEFHLRIRVILDSYVIISRKGWCVNGRNKTNILYNKGYLQSSRG